MSGAAIRMHWTVLWRLVRVSITGILQFAIAHTSWIGLVRIVCDFGAGALAGYTIAIRILIFVHFAVVGAEQRRSDTCWAEPGGRKPDRAETIGMANWLYNMIFFGGSACFSYFLPSRLCACSFRTQRSCRLAATLFAHPELRKYRVCLRNGDAAIFQRAGRYHHADDRLTSSVSGFLEIPLAYWLAIPMNLQSKGVFLSIVIAECSIAAAGMILFRRGRWKQQNI